MNKDSFLKALQSEAARFNRAASARNGDWVVKGFIDVARNVYTISVDTKVISKIMELLLFPELLRFAKNNGLKMAPAQHQNFYPDMTFVDSRDNKFALDIKSAYRTGAGRRTTRSPGR